MSSKSMRGCFHPVKPQRSLRDRHEDHEETISFVFFVNAARPSWLSALVVALSLTGTAHAQSPLADRIQAGDRKTALAMITQGTQINSTQPDGSTPLHWAVYRVDRELVQ